MESIEDYAVPGEGMFTERRQALFYIAQKRVLDIIISLLMLILLFPLLIIVALAIKLDSPGPVFHRRRVVGRGKQGFDALKLRTMVDGADSLQCQDERSRREMEENHKLQCDNRVTRIGRLLRKTSIDELPQLINVLKGQMSLVGPRMISFPEIEKFGIHQNKILSVKPGITGLWQTSGRSKLSYDDRVRLNVYYVDHQSIWLDLWILLKTIPAVLTGDGAY